MQKAASWCIELVTDGELGFSSNYRLLKAVDLHARSQSSVARRDHRGERLAKLHRWPCERNSLPQADHAILASERESLLDRLSSLRLGEIYPVWAGSWGTSKAGTCRVTWERLALPVRAALALYCGCRVSINDSRASAKAV